MFRPTPFTQSDIARSTVARVKGNRVRYFDPHTARMSKWLPNHAAQASSAALSLAVNEAITRDNPAITAAMARKYAAKTVADLRTLASKSGVKNASRMKKADIIAALTAQPFALASA